MTSTPTAVKTTARKRWETLGGSLAWSRAPNWAPVRAPGHDQRTTCHGGSPPRAWMRAAKKTVTVSVVTEVATATLRGELASEEELGGGDLGEAGAHEALQEGARPAHRLGEGASGAGVAVLAAVAGEDGHVAHHRGGFGSGGRAGTAEVVPHEEGGEGDEADAEGDSEGVGVDHDGDEGAEHGEGDGDDEQRPHDGEVDDALPVVAEGARAGAEDHRHEAAADGLGGRETDDEQEEGREEEGAADARRDGDRRDADGGGEDPPEGEEFGHFHGDGYSRPLGPLDWWECSAEGGPSPGFRLSPE